MYSGGRYDAWHAHKECAMATMTMRQCAAVATTAGTMQNTPMIVNTFKKCVTLALQFAPVQLPDSQLTNRLNYTINNRFNQWALRSSQPAQPFSQGKKYWFFCCVLLCPFTDLLSSVSMNLLLLIGSKLFQCCFGWGQKSSLQPKKNWNELFHDLWLLLFFGSGCFQKCVSPCCVHVWSWRLTTSQTHTWLVRILSPPETEKKQNKNMNTETWRKKHKQRFGNGGDGGGSMETFFTHAHATANVEYKLSHILEGCTRTEIWFYLLIKRKGCVGWTSIYIVEFVSVAECTGHPSEPIANEKPELML